MTTKTKGRLAALLILAVALGVTGWALRDQIFGDAADPSVALPGPDDFAAPPTTRTVTAPLTPGGAAGPVQDIVSLADEAVFTRVNRETGELEYRMTWESLDPQEGGVFLLTSPRAWIYQSGRTIEVSAQSGRLRWPSREREPESGLLQGDVVIAARERHAAPGLDDSAGREFVRVRAESLNFHTALGELRTDEAFTLEDDSGSTLTGSGLTIRFSQEQARPLTYVRIDGGGRYAYVPQSAAAKEHSTQGSGSARPGGERSTPSAQPKHAIYRAQCAGGVRFVTPDQTVESEQAIVWARLQDGRLAPQAVGEWRSADGRRSREEQSDDDSAEAVDARAGFTLEWNGPLEARAAPDEPSELAHDDVFLRLLSPEGGGVRLTDKAGGGIVRCVSLEYGATRRALAMFGAGPVGVTIAAPDLAEIVSGRFEFDFTTGVGAIPGPGIAKAIGAAADVDDPAFERGERPREIRWQERVDFRMDASAGPVGSGGTVLPQEVLIQGAVEAKDGTAVLRGDFVRAQFASSAGASASSEISISRLSVEGNAAAQDGSGGRILADAVEVAFARDADGNPAPTLASARGNVRAERPGETLRAGMVETRLTRSGKGFEVAALDARLGVETRIVQQSDEGGPSVTLDIRAERMDADRASGVITLQGSPASITRTEAEESGGVSGDSMRIVDTPQERNLTVFGPGAANFALTAAEPGAGERMAIEWTGSFTFDDLAGRAEALGGVAGAAEIGDRERHALRGERLLVSLTPANASGDRALLSALVESGPAPDQPAEVELRRFVPRPDGGPAALESMAFLRGSAIEVDAQRAVISTPSPGLLLIEDRRTESDDGRAGALGDMRGTSVFEWNGAMRLDRSTGEGQMTQGVRVRHRHPGGATTTELECERLNIRLAESPAGSTQDAVRLESAQAVGAVFARHDTLQLIADRMDYDAARGVIIAAAAPGNRVTIYDEAKGRHFVAEAAEVDLATGSWKATRVSAQMFSQ